MEQLKVLMINTVRMKYDGITLSIINNIRNMRHDGLQVDVLAINDVEPSLRERIAEAGAQLYVVEGRNRHPLRYLRAVRALIRKNGYQIVHAHGNSCTLAVEMVAARLGGARVRCAHSRNTQAKYVRLNRLLRPLFEGSCTHGFACGEEAGKWLFHDRPFVVLNNGTDTERFRFDPEARTALRCELGIGDRVAIGHVGNFNQQKNHRFLIEAFEKVAAADEGRVLVLIGDGPLRGEIEALTRERGLSDRVIFTGSRQDVPRLLSAMDFMVLPSLYEGFPNSVVEWQAAGLRSLVSDTVTRDCNITGLVRFLPLETEQWVNGMLELTADDNRAAICESTATAIAEAGYAIRQNAARLRSLYFEYAGVKEP